MGPDVWDVLGQGDGGVTWLFYTADTRTESRRHEDKGGPFTKGVHKYTDTSESRV